MRKRDQHRILKHLRLMTNEELLKKFEDDFSGSLGSDVPEMIEQEYDPRDIKDQKEYEKSMSENTCLELMVLQERGMDVWKDMSKKGKA
jgi:hypothetical protein